MSGSLPPNNTTTAAIQSSTSRTATMAQPSPQPCHVNALGGGCVAG